MLVTNTGTFGSVLAALRFRLRDRSGTTTVPVVYRGSVPDLFKPGREVVVDGKLIDGTFVAVRDTLVTKCPSKYAPAVSGKTGNR